MKQRVWTAPAARHLFRIHAFISRSNLGAADKLIARIIRATERLEHYPLSAPAYRIPGTRQLVVPGLPYVVIYSVTAQAIVIHGVFHTARDPRKRGFHED